MRGSGVWPLWLTLYRIWVLAECATATATATATAGSSQFNCGRIAGESTRSSLDQCSWIDPIDAVRLVCRSLIITNIVLWYGGLTDDCLGVSKVAIGRFVMLTLYRIWILAECATATATATATAVSSQFNCWRVGVESLQSSLDQCSWIDLYWLDYRRGSCMIWWVHKQHIGTCYVVSSRRSSYKRSEVQ